MRHRKRGRTVLVLVDFINTFEFPGGQSLAPRAVRAARVAARMKAQLTAVGCPCIYANDNFGEWRTDFPALVKASLGRDDASGKIAAMLTPTSRDLSVLKPRNSAFYGTPLDFLLMELNAETLVIAGIAIDMCVLATAQDAHMRKFGLKVPANCVAGFNRAQEAASLALMKRTLSADIAQYRGR